MAWFEACDNIVTVTLYGHDPLLIFLVRLRQAQPSRGKSSDFDHGRHDQESEGLMTEWNANDLQGSATDTA